MKRTDASGNLANKFTDGNPGTGVPATVVEQTWLNTAQEELCYLVEQNGGVLDQTGANTTQILTAIQAMIQKGNGGSISQVIANNTASPTNITGLAFTGGTYSCVRINYEIDRHTDTGGTEVAGAGTIIMWWKPSAAAWSYSIVEQNNGDDHGVTLTVTAAGQVQYISSNIAGANYFGKIRVGHVQTSLT